MFGRLEMLEKQIELEDRGVPKDVAAEFFSGHEESLENYSPVGRTAISYSQMIEGAIKAIDDCDLKGDAAVKYLNDVMASYSKVCPGIKLKKNKKIVDKTIDKKLGHLEVLLGANIRASEAIDLLRGYEDKNLAMLEYPKAIDFAIDSIKYYNLTGEMAVNKIRESVEGWGRLKNRLNSMVYDSRFMLKKKPTQTLLNPNF